MAIGSGLWRVGRRLVLVGALAATFITFAAVGMRVALRAREVRVPDLTGRTASSANHLLTERGLTIRVDDTRRPDSHVPAGRIVQQEPAAGAIARRPRSVRVWVSAGPRVSVVPPLVGETLRTAQMRADEHHLAIATVSRVELAGRGDLVVAQAPAAAQPGDRVSLLVNREPAARYVMPALVGLDAARAAEALGRAGFRVSIADSPPRPGVPSGLVLTQMPQDGVQVTVNDPIALEVSR